MADASFVRKAGINNTWNCDYLVRTHIDSYDSKGRQAVDRYNAGVIH